MIDYIEIREHINSAEGSANSKPSKKEVKQAIKDEGYIGFNVGIDYDSLMRMWRFVADIK